MQTWTDNRRFPWAQLRNVCLRRFIGLSFDWAHKGAIQGCAKSLHVKVLSVTAEIKMPTSDMFSQII